MKHQLRVFQVWEMCSLELEAEDIGFSKSYFENLFWIPFGQEKEIQLFSCVCPKSQPETGFFIYYKCYPHSQIGLAYNSEISKNLEKIKNVRILF